jgi:hypothetical protein
MIGIFSWRRAALAVSFLATPLLVSSLASAQTDEQRAIARSMATDGASAFNGGHYKEAVELFSKAESLVHAPPHLLFLARSHTKLGQFVRAREAYLKITKEQLPTNAPKAFFDAQSAASEEVSSVESHIGRLVVNVEGADAIKGLSVSVDGLVQSAVLLGVAMPADPGVHQVAANAPGFKAATASVTLKDADRQSVTLKLVPAPEAAPPTAPVPMTTTAAVPVAGPRADAPPPAAPADGSASNGASGLRIGAYAAAGVGVVGLGLGTVFGLKSKSKRSEADTANSALQVRCPCRKDDPEAIKVAGLDSDAKSAQTLSVVGFVLGGVGLATGVTLFVLSSKHEEKTAFIAPFVGLGGAGVHGAF